MKVGTDIRANEKMKFDGERARDEQILILSCCIDKLRLRIKEEADAKHKAQLVNLENMLLLCLANLDSKI